MLIHMIKKQGNQVGDLLNRNIIEKLVKGTHGYSGSDIKAVIISFFISEYPYIDKFLACIILSNKFNHMNFILALPRSCSRPYKRAQPRSIKIYKG